MSLRLRRRSRLPRRPSAASDDPPRPYTISRGSMSPRQCTPGASQIQELCGPNHRLSEIICDGILVYVLLAKPWREAVSERFSDIACGGSDAASMDAIPWCLLQPYTIFNKQRDANARESLEVRSLRPGRHRRCSADHLDHVNFACDDQNSGSHQQGSTQKGSPFTGS